MTLFRGIGRRQPPAPVRLPAPELGLNWSGIGPEDRRDGGMGPLDGRFDPCGAPPIDVRDAAGRKP